MAGVVQLWNKWEVQILVLVSFALQVFLFMFARMRWRNISGVPRILIWLAYLLADSTAVYTLGHMSLSGTPHGHQQLVAFWAPFLLVHLGGQDTITAYAIEDNQLWLRHLLTLAVQALAGGYVIYKYIITSSGALVTPSLLMFAVGVLKNGERIWALKSSKLDNTSKYLHSVSDEALELDPNPKARWFDSEEVLQGAHDMIHICMGQFADYKFWPSPDQSEAIKSFDDRGCMYELVEMQLSLMHDILYTKAAVIHTWYGCCIRAVSFVAIATAFLLFQSSTGKYEYNTANATVTYILLAGALLLEVASVLRAMGSTWTCASLRVRGWDRLNSILISLRRSVKAAERNRRWSGSIGRPNLDLFTSTRNASLGRMIARKIGCEDLWDKLHYSSSTVISTDTKELVLKEIFRMAKACQGKEDTMRSYRGQCALKQCRDGFFEELSLNTAIDFDDSILTWHVATHIFIRSLYQNGQQNIVEAIRTLSNYMMFLLVECPYMLPSPVSPRLCVSAREGWTQRRYWWHFMKEEEFFACIKREEYEGLPSALVPGVKLATRLLAKEPDELLQVLLGVWVEMLCYAAHHCSTDSHARNLNNGGEFITIVWLLTTAAFNRSYCDDKWFKEDMLKFYLRHGILW